MKSSISCCILPICYYQLGLISLSCLFLFYHQTRDVRSDTEESDDEQLVDSTEMNGNLVKEHNDTLSNKTISASNSVVKGQ